MLQLAREKAISIYNEIDLHQLYFYSDFGHDRNLTESDSETGSSPRSPSDTPGDSFDEYLTMQPTNEDVTPNGSTNSPVLGSVSISHRELPSFTDILQVTSIQYRSLLTLLSKLISTLSVYKRI